jgi:glutathionylspermidine synthase
VIQWFWLADRFQAELDRKEVDQFNSIHESLIDTWKLIGPSSAKVHFTGCTDVPEDHQTLLYLADTASQAGKQVELIDISRVGWNGSLRRFWGETDPLDAVFKLYPWEDLFLEEFGKYLGVSPPSGSSLPGKSWSRTKPCYRFFGRCTRIIRTCCRHMIDRIA